MEPYIGWRFPPLAGGSKQGYSNNDIEAFKGEELIDNLAREICQNSLDAKTPGSSEPVEVVFELKYVPSNEKVFQEYKECLQGCRNFWGAEMDAHLENFLAGAEEMLQRDQIPVLVASDYNTLGLSGSRDDTISSPWEALAGSEGVSVKSSETSGGSFGIGKNAPFACSSLSMVFYNTLSSYSEQAFIVVGQLAYLLCQDDKPTQGVGRYQFNDDENECWKPVFEENEDDFRDQFLREKHGTDVIIAGFIQEEDWMNAVAKAVLKNFFVAISEGRLIVRLKDETESSLFNVDIDVDATSVAQLIDGYSHEDPKMITTAELFSAFVAPDAHEYLSIVGENDAELFVKSDSSYKRNIAHFRDTGMLIYIKSRRIFQHYAAVFIVRGTELGELLRATEPARHNRWDHKLIQNNSKEGKEKRNDAKQALETIDDEVINLLRQQYESTSETEVDAVGVGEYLPDDTDGIGVSSEGSDVLRPKIQVSVKKPVKNKTKASETVPGIKGEGFIQEGDVHNSTRNPDAPPLDQLTKAVDPNGEGTFGEGVLEGSGTKDLTQPIS
ncbi:MAG: hypothetical protein LUD72_05160, partial [Bacteroidales bacterium]|nr:hypothetical protein [Bacteroidales bacterium]